MEAEAGTTCDINDKAAYVQRFKVERTFAWLGNFRRLLIRWERHLEIYQRFLYIRHYACLHQQTSEIASSVSPCKPIAICR